MTSSFFSSIRQSMLVSVNDLESEAIREQRRFLLHPKGTSSYCQGAFSKKVREKQSYSLKSIETMKNESNCIKVTI